MASRFPGEPLGHLRYRAYPDNVPARFAEVTLSLPEFVAPANQVASYLYTPDEPPPPPPKPDETREGQTSPWRQRPMVAGVSEEVDEKGKPDAANFPNLYAFLSISSLIAHLPGMRHRLSQHRPQNDVES